MEGVEFERWKWSFTVSSPTLGRLTIRREEWDNTGLDCRGLAYEFDRLSFDTPGLTYLEYDDYVPKQYPFVNLDSLVEAKLDLLTCVTSGWEERHAKDFDPMNLINALKNVKILDLNTYTMKMIYVFRKVIPVFENLFHLSVLFSYDFWLSLPILLKISPNLKTLIVKGSLRSYDSDKELSVCGYALLSSPVEVLKIMCYYGSNKELEQMKQFLEKLSCLKLVVVEVSCHKNGEEKVRVLTDLLMLPRASTKCKIQVTFS